MKYIQYNSTTCIEVEETKSEYKPENLDQDRIHWFNIPISDNETVLRFCNNFIVHDLTMSDISNVDHLPKLDEFDNYLYFIGKHAYVDESIHQINIEHFSLILGKNYVLCFYEGKFDDIISYIYKYIISQSIKIDRKEADFLFYLIIDTVVDKYLDVIEYIREEAEDLEEITLEQEPENRTKEIIGIKANLNKLAASCFFTARSYSKAAEIFKQLGMWSQAGECIAYIGKDRMKEAAGYFEKGGLILRAIECYE